MCQRAGQDGSAHDEVGAANLSCRAAAVWPGIPPTVADTAAARCTAELAPGQAIDTALWLVVTFLTTSPIR